MNAVDPCFSGKKMLAVFKTGGKQYSVKTGQILRVEKLDGKKGDSVLFKDILTISDSKIHTIGKPLIQGASVQAKILEQIRDKKIIVFKKRQRQNYRHTQGHRQYLTILKIESIKIESKKSSSLKKDIIKKTVEKKVLKKETVTPKKTTASKKTATVKKTAIKKKVTLKKEIKK